MVWAEQIGSSITVPSDWSPGDTRNHMTLGDDVPQEIGDQFTAVLGWFSGRFSGNPSQDFPNGFKYWSWGISKSGNLEVVALYYTVSAPAPTGIYRFYRQTVLSMAPPVGVDNPPVLSLGYNPNYATYGESTTSVIAGSGIKLTTDGNTMYTGTLLGADIPTGRTPLMQYGSVVVTTNAAGDAAVTFNQPFPNGVSTVIPQSGDWTAATTINPWAGPTVTGFSIRAYNATGGVLASRAVRVNYTAVGW